MPQLRVSADQARQQRQDAETPLFRLLPPALPSIQRVREPHRLLSPGPFAQQQDVLALEFVEGCVQACPFCPVNATRAGATVRLVDNAAEVLAAELDVLTKRPRAVFVSPTTDPFPPLHDIQHETTRIIEVLARRGVEAWLMTRGFIRPAAMRMLQQHAAHVKVTVAMTTLDRPLQRLLEPLTAPPRLRLRNLAELRENLLPLLEALASAGVQHVTVGYLMLHARAEQALMTALRPLGLGSLVAEEYARGPMLSRVRGMAGRYLPRARRQHGYAALMAMASSFGIRVSVNALTNPDFAGAPRPPVVRGERSAPLQLVH
jgi:hypothetical protein